MIRDLRALIAQDDEPEPWWQVATAAIALIVFLIAFTHLMAAAS